MREEECSVYVWGVDQAVAYRTWLAYHCADDACLVLFLFFVFDGGEESFGTVCDGEAIATVLGSEGLQE